MEAIEHVKRLISENYRPVISLKEADTTFTTEELVEKLKCNLPVGDAGLNEVYEALVNLEFKLFDRGDVDFVWGCKSVL